MFTDNPYKIPRTVPDQTRMWICDRGAGVRGKSSVSSNNTLLIQAPIPSVLLLLLPLLLPLLTPTPRCIIIYYGECVVKIMICSKLRIFYFDVS